MDEENKKTGESCRKEDKTCLENMKKEYEEFRKKYDLPSFNKLNEDFYIEKSADVETDFLLREIRRSVSDKLVNYLRFFEAFMNPSTAPVFIHSIVKTFDEKSKSIVKETYGKLSKREVELIDLDLEYDEKKEAEFIKSVEKEWDEIKKEIKEVLKTINKNWNTKSETNNKNYFG